MKYIVFCQSDDYEFNWYIYPSFKVTKLMLLEHTDFSNLKELEYCAISKIKNNDIILGYIFDHNNWIMIKQLDINIDYFYLWIIRNKSEFKFQAFDNNLDAHMAFERYVLLNIDYYQSWIGNQSLPNILKKYSIGDQFYPYFSKIEKISCSNYEVS